VTTMSGQNPFGASGGAKQKSSSSSSSSGPSISLATPPREVAKFIVMGVDNLGGLAEWPVFDEDAQEVATMLEADLPEDVRELLEAFPEDTTHLSFESFFQVDLAGEGVEYVGTPPLLNEGDKDEWSDLPEDVKDKYEDGDIYKYGDPDNDLKSYIPKPGWVELVREDKVEDSIIYEASTILNGVYAPLIRDYLYTGEPVKLGVGIGRDHNHQGDDGEADEFGKRQNVAFAKQTGKSSAGSVVTAMENMGTISEDTASDFEDGALDFLEVVNSANSDEDDE